MEFINGLKRIWVDMKIYLTLKMIYPTKPRYERIKIILANDVEVEEDVVIEKNVELGHLKKLNRGLYIGHGSYIGACSSIGNFTSISLDVKIGLMAHPLDYISTSPVFYAKRRGWVVKSTFNETLQGLTEIGHDVLISANVTILAGVKVGNGAVIGAGAFVNKDVPPYAVVVGTPARIVKYRFSEDIIRKLEEIKWWDMSKEELMKYKLDFNNVEEFIKNLENNVQ